MGNTFELRKLPAPRALWVCRAGTPGYHQSMKAFRAVAAGWYHGVLLAALPWIAAVRPAWAPAVVAVVGTGLLLAGRGRAAGPWPGAVAALSSLLFVLLRAGIAIGVGWLVLVVVVCGIAWIGGRRGGAGRLVSAVVALAGWAIALLAVPGLIAIERGGWLAPALLLLAARDATLTELWHRANAGPLLPPTREARGTLSVRSLVVRDDSGLPCTVPLDLELRAGDSVAVLSASLDEALALADTLTGSRRPVSGEVAVDGTPLVEGERLVALVAFGVPFLPADLEENLAALCDEHPDRQTIGAVIEACGLDEVAELLDGAPLAGDGAPLAPVHRLQVAAARVLPSDYRVLVVVDPSPWTDPVRRELWRRSIVRASLGRTAVWFTADRELASRADRAMTLANGTLRRMDSASEGGPRGREMVEG